MCHPNCQSMFAVKMGAVTCAVFYEEKCDLRKEALPVVAGLLRM